jgi:hypothetical protein
MAAFPGMLLSEPAVGEHLSFAWPWVRSMTRSCPGGLVRGPVVLVGCRAG